MRLDEWMRAEGVKQVEVPAREPALALHRVHKLFHLRDVPTRAEMAAIVRLTGGAVTPLDFFPEAAEQLELLEQGRAA